MNPRGEDSTIYYFAYGSNMLTERLQQRVAGCERVGVARLEGHVLRFHKQGRDRSAKCDACFTGARQDCLFGVIYAMPRSQRPALDAAEGLGRGYELKTVSVNPQGCTTAVEVFLYYATDIASGLLPFDWYKALVLGGARQHALPEDYIEACILPVVTQSDSDVKRSRQYHALVQNALDPAR